MSAPYDRPAREPGGCECFECGVIFIGEPWHSTCAVCLAQVGTHPQGGDAKQAPGDSLSDAVAEGHAPQSCSQSSPGRG